MNMSISSVEDVAAEPQREGGLRVMLSDGVVRDVAASPGHSVMELIRDAGIAELPAYCGGVCSCATCHVYVGAEWLSLLPPMSDDEDALLDSIANRASQSRLSCQIPFSAQLHGMEATVAVEE